MPYTTCPVTGLPTGSCECFEYLGEPVTNADAGRADELPEGFMAEMIQRYELVKVAGRWERRITSTLPRI